MFAPALSKILHMLLSMVGTTDFVLVIVHKWLHINWAHGMRPACCILIRMTISLRFKVMVVFGWTQLLIIFT